jgi:hypothetical protein
MKSPIIHINRKYHIELDAIIGVTKKRWGSVWVTFIDKKTKQTKNAIAKQDIGTILTIINTWKIMRQESPFIGKYEK